MSETGEIAAFYAARLDETEAKAKANARADGEWARVICDPVIGAFGGQSRERNIAMGLYVAAMSDPARVLRRVAAGRRLIFRYQAAVAAMQDDSYDPVVSALGAQLRDEASAWDDHPDYRKA